MYDGVSDWFKFPAPVAAAVHGVCGLPLNTIPEAGQVTVVVDGALSIVNVCGTCGAAL
jgi:hypothetical protein